MFLFNDLFLLSFGVGSVVVSWFLLSPIAAIGMWIGFGQLYAYIQWQQGLFDVINHALGRSDQKYLQEARARSKDLLEKFPKLSELDPDFDPEDMCRRSLAFTKKRWALESWLACSFLWLPIIIWALITYPDSE